MLTLAPARGREALWGRGAEPEETGLFILGFPSVHSLCLLCGFGPANGHDDQVGHTPRVACP